MAIKKLAILLILINFIFSFSTQLKIPSFENYNEIGTISSITTTINSLISSECEDCHNDGCQDHSSHCLHHCTGSHYFLVVKQTVKVNHKADKNHKNTWYVKSHYNEPYLDPALKPPLFS